MICVICTRVHAERPLVCDHDRNRLAGTLRELAAAYAALGRADPEPVSAGQLVAGPTRSQTGSGRVSGSREAPVPVSLDLVDLTAQARAGTVHDPVWRDQVGYPSVASVLDQWARDWLDTLPNIGEYLPAPTVPVLLDWLGKRLGVACDRHPAVDEFAGEVHDLLWACRRAAGEVPPRPELCGGVPCRRCDLMTLYRVPGSDWIECGSCPDLMSADEYARWVGILAANARTRRADLRLDR
jgi:hypothetical protein